MDDRIKKAMITFAESYHQSRVNYINDDIKKLRTILTSADNWTDIVIKALPIVEDMNKKL